MNRFIKVFLIVVAFIFLGYLLIPSPQFPGALPDALLSNEPADTESPLRKAYFTNATRSEVLALYSKEFKWGYWLNYPPEESGRIIRDQTRSTFLQEIVHPFKESLYVNGYEPADNDDKNRIYIDGNHYRQKIIVKYVPSSTAVRVLVFFLTIISIIYLIREYINAKRS